VQSREEEIGTADPVRHRKGSVPNFAIFSLVAACELAALPEK
jgi:hypothetical protein